MDPKDELQGFSLEDIMKEFGSVPDDPQQPSDEQPPVGDAGEDAPSDEAVPSEDAAPAEEPAATSGDTIRLDHLPKGMADTGDVPGTPLDEQPEPTPEEPAAEPFSQEWEPEYDQPMGEYIPSRPVVIRPKSRLRELKRKLIEGPEKRYYELTEKGLGRLQLTIFLNVLLVLLSAASTAMYALGMVPPERLKLMIYFQFLMMMLSGVVGCYRIMDGIGDLFHGRFTLNTLLFFTFLACGADGMLCLFHEKIPCCAAFSLQMLMSQWNAYQTRNTEMGQMDTMRKATRLDSVVKQPEFFEGRPGFLRGEGQVEDFMDTYNRPSRPQMVLRFYAFFALLGSIGIGVAAWLLHDYVLGVRAFAASLLAAMPATIFITLSRPEAILEKRLHKLGTVICGWQGVQGLCGAAAYPLDDNELFPAGTVKLNGVKFYGDRDPDDVVAYATALINALGGGLAPIFTQLLESRNGARYEVENLRCYGGGGIGGEVCQEPVLMGALSFLQDMGVEIPEGTRVNQAVYVAIDGQFAGLFAVTYSKDKSSAAGLTTLCAYRKLSPVVTSADFMLTEGFLRSKFDVNTRRITFPPREDRDAMASLVPDPELPALALTTTLGLAPAAYAVTGARALRTASRTGAAIHMVGGILGLGMMTLLAILGAEAHLTPGNLFLYELVWMIPGLLVTEWTRSV